MAVSDRGPKAAARWFVPVAVSMLVVLATLNSVSAARAGTPQQPEESVVAALGPAIFARLPRGDGDVTLRAASPGASFFLYGLVLSLEHRGVAARVDPSQGWIFGDHRVHRTGRVRADLSVVIDLHVEVLLKRPDLRLLAYHGTLSIPERARVLARLAAADAAHQAGRLTDKRYLQLRIPLQTRLGTAVAVFETRRVS